MALRLFILPTAGSTSVLRCHGQRHGQLQAAIPLLPLAKVQSGLDKADPSSQQKHYQISG